MIMCFGCLVACKDKDENTDDGNGNTTGGGGGGGNTTDDGDDELEPGWWDDITYDSQSLIFQMTHNSNKQELPSGCERYLAGATKDNEAVDTLVRTRNSDAYKYTKVKATYLYYPDNNEAYMFSKARDEITGTIDNSSKDNCPDIFCNWMTDMLLVSLKGKFANLMTQDESTYGKNHFDIRLTEDAAENQFGYMTELMRSLTLKQGQIYVIASDYFIDLIRAFFVVPVNVNLFNQIAQTADPALTDLNRDTKVNIDDFMVEVEQGGWTYDRLIQYSKAIYDGAVGGESYNNVLGFALGKNGLPAAGMVYTSSAEIIKRSTENGVTTYTYPETNEKLDKIMKKISSMMDVDGIMCMTDADAGNLGLQGDEKTALLGIRHKFTTNTMLFGGVILVGSLEYSAYQDMKKTGGFAVVPVPVYEAGDRYLTQIHVVGRAGGVTAKKTEKFEACSAFLQYQTENSTEVLDHYYRYNLTYGTASGVTGNIKMLQYIRNNVRTSFDKLFEDAIGFFYNNGINESDRYHTLLSNRNYKFDDFTDVYDEKLPLKVKNLGDLEKEYAKLPK